MSGQAIAVVGAIGVAKYRGQRTRPGGDWLFGTVITAGLLLSFMIGVLHG